MKEKSAPQGGGRGPPRICPIQVDPLVVVELYGNQLNQNYGNHLDDGIVKCVLWENLLILMPIQSTRWYATPPGSVGP